ncbi:MAG: hypothetical protein EA401_14680 [Planctomycetota bacterium]|nr:MAG: hypothetical protein EA401_14680 [Planctomycetota bacterium]
MQGSRQFGQYGLKLFPGLRGSAATGAGEALYHRLQHTQQRLALVSTTLDSVFNHQKMRQQR